MPPNTLQPWREALRKAAHAIRKQLAQTEQEIASFLRPGRAPQAIPVPLPRQRQPRFPGDKRFYTNAAFPKRTANSTRVSTLVRTEFGRSLVRPRLDGTLKAHGYRNFSSATINHAQIANEVFQSVSLGLRAGVLNTPFYPPATGHHKGHVVAGLCGAEQTTTTLSIPLFPVIAAPLTGSLSRETVSELDEVLCAAPQHLARSRRALSRLLQFGSFDYEMTRNSIDIFFYGKTRGQVERFLGDLGVACGTLHEQTGILARHADLERDANVNWCDVFDRPPPTHSVESLHGFIDAVDMHRCGTTIRAN